MDHMQHQHSTPQLASPELRRVTFNLIINTIVDLNYAQLLGFVKLRPWSR
jgi:hypothetical protein